MKKKILITGGGTGGHFYPILAIIEALKKEINEEEIEIVYLGPKNETFLKELEKFDIKTYFILSSKIHRYFSLQNIIELPKFFISLIQALFKLYLIMPDVIFLKGGPGSLAVSLAGVFYFIPIIVHESDSIPSLTTKIISRFSKKIILAFEESINYFEKKQKVVVLGNPLREDLIKNKISKEEAKKILGFENAPPLIVVLGGSQGSQRINNFIFSNFEDILKNFQVFHQVGDNNFSEAELIVENLKTEVSSSLFSKYKMSGFLDSKEMAIVLSAADVVFSRAGAGAIFEIAFFGKPAILVPLPESAQNHQKLNAYIYEKNNAAIVLEEDNLKFSNFLLEAEEILKDENYKLMSEAALSFSKKDSAYLIAKEILSFLK